MSIFPTRILLASDGSQQAELATRTAVDIAATTNSELHMVTVARLDYVQKSAYGAIERTAREVLDEHVKKIEQTGGSIPQVHLLRGRPDREIAHLADEIGAGLIVMGSRGLGGLQRALIGSVSASVVRHAHCPVLIVRGEMRALGESYDSAGGTYGTVP